HVSCHIVKVVFVRFVAFCLNGVQCCICGIVSTLGFKVGHKTARIADHIGSTPWVGTSFDSSPCGVFPLCLGGQPELVHKLFAAAFLVIVLELGPPVTECLGLHPVHAHHGIIAIGIMPEVIIVHGLVIGVFKILDPNGGVRVYFQ